MCWHFHAPKPCFVPLGSQNGLLRAEEVMRNRAKGGVRQMGMASKASNGMEKEEGGKAGVPLIITILIIMVKMIKNG